MLTSISIFGERDKLEQDFPMYAEHPECDGKPIWGGVKIGRIPEFLYVDASADVTDVRPQAREQDTATFRDAFNRAFRYCQNRCQFHVDRLVNGKR